eukprot:TRINITY_DN5930_c0_g1_i1.p1 TRINITY_DN5930_c0_g1~~TRINITY_DN5930_c0_g1_i1.p1  ORF type:complete len:418 (-),score=61.29 TRINITY_DN5930_c0_g1_i1:53-1306(-)
MRRVVESCYVVLVLCMCVEMGWSYTFTKVGTNQGQTYIEMRGVGSGIFNASKLSNWQFDIRRPLISPNAGGSCPHNIYNPNVVNNGASNWNIYFGGWDGVSSCHDSVSVTVTPDNFTTFNPHDPIIATGSVIHVNNPSAIKVNSNLWVMITTQLQQNPQLNKPAVATSSNGVNWSPNQGGVPSANIVVQNYPYNWANADVNGGNVVYFDSSTGLYHLYFIDFKQESQHAVFHAVSSGDLTNFVYKGISLSEPNKIVNDFKYINGNYLMGCHINGATVFYSVSNDLNSPFPPSRPLFNHFDSSDQYIVSIGFVVDSSNTRLLGALYGAGAESSLDHNRIFGVWLQKRVLFFGQNTIWGVGNADRSNGPDSVFIATNAGNVQGRFYVYDSDYVSFANRGTLLAVSDLVTVNQGDIWQFS